MKTKLSQRFYQAFTLLELLIVLLVLGILSSLVAPSLSRTRPAGQAIQCLNNTRQLIAAWQMYAQDNSDKIVISLHGGEAQGGIGDPLYGPGWAAGWLDWTTATDNTNVAFLVNERYAKLAKYVNKATNLFKCPADRYLSPQQKSRGWTARVRSYSGNIGIGAGNAEAGPWDTLYRHIRKTSEFLFPGPTETWVFLEEHPDSMNDPAFFSPNRLSWVDLPATYHNGAASFAFADGHSEMHKWTGSLTRVRSVIFNWNPPVPPAADPDIHWMSYHSQRASTNSF